VRLTLCPYPPRFRARMASLLAELISGYPGRVTARRGRKSVRRRSSAARQMVRVAVATAVAGMMALVVLIGVAIVTDRHDRDHRRSEEHTSELQSREN